MSLDQLKASLTELKDNITSSTVYIKLVDLVKLVIATVVTFVKYVKVSYDVALLEQRKAELEELFNEYSVHELPLEDIETLTIEEIATRIASEIKETINEVEK